MNRQKLALAVGAAAVAIGVAIWAISNSGKPSVPTEPVAPGPNATYRSADEPPATSTSTGATTHP